MPSVPPVMSSKDRILKVISIKTETNNEFKQLLTELIDKHSQYYFNDIMDMLSSSEHELLTKKLHNLTNESIILISSTEEGSDSILITSKVLQQISELLLLYLETTKYRFNIIFTTIQNLHDILISLDETQYNTKQIITSIITLKTLISRLCEYCWIHKETASERFITQLIPYLLLNSLKSTAHENDIKRVYKIHSAFTLLDYEANTIESIHIMLMNCYTNILYLKYNDGKKFLSYLFSVHLGLHKDILHTMRTHLLDGHNSDHHAFARTQMTKIATAYGDILYNAWKHMVDDSAEKQSIEESLQALLHQAIHSSNPPYFNALRIILNTFHEAKRYKGVDSMLLRVYGPILWRSLKCANYIVRVQATMIFFDSFPLQDEEASASESDLILQKQFDMLTPMLKDDDHRVRSAAATGVCHVLKEFWAALPASTTKQALSYVVGTLGRDASDATVRVAVMSGLYDLLDQPLAHPVMKSLLPLLSNTIHDVSERVRVGFIQILIKVIVLVYKPYFSAILR